jgi:DNA-binding response OmpR family regulator
MSMTSGADKIRVLILDDEVGFLDLCREFFGRDDGVQAEFVSSPVKALEMAGEGDYHVIVSDHTLPGMDGIQFLRALRSLHQRMPFILLTGNGREGLAIEAVQNGADFYMEKAGSPSSMFEQLIGTIRALVDNGRTRIADCLPDRFEVFSKGGVLFVSNGGERVMAAIDR